MKLRGGLMVLALLLAGCAGHVRLASTGDVGCGVSCDNVIMQSVGDRVFFALAKSNLNSDGVAALHRQATWMAAYPSINVQVAGNADERGTETYNLALGQRRADTARDGLEAQGVAASRIMRTVSYGKDCPVAPGHDAASWEQNRNAITSVIGGNPQDCHAGH